MDPLISLIDTRCIHLCFSYMTSAWFADCMVFSNSLDQSEPTFESRKAECAIEYCIKKE